MKSLQDYARKLSREEINALPLRRYAGPVHLVRTESDMAQALEMLRGETVLGFDTETRPTFRKGTMPAPSLMQLAASGCVFLVQLAHVGLSGELACVLSRRGVIKAGVSIHDDMRELQRLHPFEPGGVVDLGDIARRHGIGTHGLRNLAANFFGWRISKGLQCSNWSLPELSEGQISYAATDAWVGRIVYLRMRELGIVTG
ncbi:MAG: 3'-5' exonuclease domain-containing protein 2 [Desulfovibrionaceae bacterium]|nr:3'-5' exonuclease domain-containing protein 2 [Desulfovibrionaceae bacterium]